jgi:hypothetical protein
VSHHGVQIDEQLGPEIAQGTAQNHRDALDAMRIARIRLLGVTLD